MGDTTTKVLSRMLFGEPTPIKILARINQVRGGSFADIEITLRVTASMFSPGRTTEQLQDDIRRAIDARFGVRGIPFLSVEIGHQEKDGTGELLKDVLEGDRYCQSKGCNRRLQPGDMIYCKRCSDEINS